MRCEFGRYDVAAAPAGDQGPPVAPATPVLCDADQDTVERVQVGTCVMWLCPEHIEILDPPKEVR